MRVMVALARGFEDTEAFAVIDTLRRAGIPTETVGVVGTTIESRSGVRVMTDKRLGQISVRDYDAIVLPGGMECTNSLGKCAPLIYALKAYVVSGKIVAAIGQSVSILAKQGFLDDKKAAIYPGMEKLLAYPRDQKVVIDNNIITSQGPGTALEFGLALVKKLKGDSTVQRVRTELVV